MARHPSTEGNDLSPRRVDAQVDVTVPDGNGGKLSFAEAVEGITAEVEAEFSDIKNRDYSLIENTPQSTAVVSSAGGFTDVFEEDAPMVEVDAIRNNNNFSSEVIFSTLDGSLTLNLSGNETRNISATFVTNVDKLQRSTSLHVKTVAQHAHDIV